MAKAKGSSGPAWHPDRHKKVTSIGNSVRTRYNSKNDKRLGKKKYRGQG
jgi:hypothetical protein